MLEATGMVMYGLGWVELRRFFDPTHHGELKKIQLNPTHHKVLTQPTLIGLDRVEPMG